MSLKKQLDRYRQHLNKSQSESVESKPDKVDDDQTKTAMEKVADDLDAKLVCFENEYILVKEQSFPLSQNHGLYPFSALSEVVDQWQIEATNHPLSAKGKQPTDLLFFDTETTGLGSGVGQMIFLLGCARVIRDEIQIKQYFLPGPGHEAALYHYFLNDVKSLQNLVTFNGKAFDWPKVKTRHTFIRDRVPKLPAFGHYDLLHAARRFWKHELPSTRLSVVEKEILNVNRDFDVPGHMAPFLYFQFLKRPDAALVDGIFTHNAIDILSLITLYIHQSTLLLQRENGRATDQENYQMGRWYQYIKETEAAMVCFQAVSEQSRYKWEAKRELAIIYKKSTDYRQAIALYEDIIGDPDKDDFPILIELAKLHEHKIKNYDRALEYAENALMILDKQDALLKQPKADLKEALIRRIERVKKKRK